MRIPEDATPRELHAIIAGLEARRRSSNLSKPPSSDIVKPPRPRPPSGDGRRKIGGQPGTLATNASFPPEEVLAKRTREHGEAYFTFITTPGGEPTNNVAEQAIRFVVTDRRITQGTRGETGRRWCERIWTAMATCAQQGRSLYRFLVDAVRAHFARARPPSLLPSGS
jgi:transposase